MLGVTISTLDPEQTVQTIEFVFKQTKKEDAEVLVTKLYDPNGESTAIKDENDDNLFYLQFTDEESRQFKPDNTYYMDTRIIYESGSIPQTEIVKLYSLPTLFEEEAENNGD